MLAGALVLFSSEPQTTQSKSSSGDVNGILERLGNVRRLMASVLFLNDDEVSSPVQPCDKTIYILI